MGGEIKRKKLRKMFSIFKSFGHNPASPPPILWNSHLLVIHMYIGGHRSISILNLLRCHLNFYIRRRMIRKQKLQRKKKPYHKINDYQHLKFINTKLRKYALAQIDLNTPSRKIGVQLTFLPDWDVSMIFV